MRIIFFLISILIVVSCKKDKSNSLEDLEISINNQISNIEGDIALAFTDLSCRTPPLLINVDGIFHAASTMKVPVMIELYKQQLAGELSLQDSIMISNKFISIVDSSSYQLNINDDSDDIIYKYIGSKLTIHELITSMITVSSNLATNILIELVSVKKINQTMRSFGAINMNVLRGVEDQKAFDLGLSNTTTAKDLSIIMKGLALKSFLGTEECDAMISVLKHQKWNDMIPKYLPKDIDIAHKTGAISHVHHDAAIVYLPNGNAYILVLLSKNLKNFETGTEKLAQISKTIYNFMVSQDQ